jgi:hypothetical protein
MIAGAYWSTEGVGSMAVFETNIFVSEKSGASVTKTVLFPSVQSFVAWGAITWIDPRVGAFDTNNAIGFDIPYFLDELHALVDTERVFFSDGGALGPDGDPQNLRKSSIAASGTGVVFRLRAYPRHPVELACVANCVVIMNP